MGHVQPHPEAANRWIAVEVDDESTCEPCSKNNGKLYKSRADAYKDYPGGAGYVNCVGAEHGNECRGTVKKRRGGKKSMTPELLASLQQVRARESTMNAKDFTSAVGPEQGLRVTAPTAQAASTKLYLYDYIGGYNGVTAMGVVEALAGVTGDVDLHINSGGGSIFEGTAIYHNLVNYSGGKLRAYVDGVAASAASLIAMAGEEIVVEPAATMMIHDGSGGVWGTAKDMRNTADVLDLLSDQIAAVYAHRAGGTATAWREIMQSGDTWYSATAAVEAGLATRAGTLPSKPADPDEDEDEPEDLAALAAVARVFTARIPTLTRPAPLVPARVMSSDDVEGIRNAMKGLFA